MEDNNLFYCASKDTTPMMSQYFATKAQYPGCILLFRMGDFFEMFFDDAKTASSILNIALTSRGKHLEQDIPMCGIPVAALDNYVGKLVKYGYKVAVCDQIEDPQEAKKRGYKAIVKREVTRILTAGTLVEDNFLNSNKNNFLMAVVPEVVKKTAQIKTVSFAVIDISTGDFFVNTVIANEFDSTMDMYQPKEIIIPSYFEKSEFAKKLKTTKISLTFLPDSKFNSTMEKERLEKYFKVKTLDSFGINSNNELSVCGAILEYLLITQRDNFSSLPIPRKMSFSNYLVIDASTSKSLEITTSVHGEYEYSLLGVIDQTKTAFGARLLASRVSMPVIEKNLLEKRLDCVEFFIKNKNLAEKIREELSICPDMERSISRIRFNKFAPRDVGDIRESLRIMIKIKSILNGSGLPSEGEYFIENMRDFSDLLKLLDKALVEKLPAGNKDGGMIADGYSRELDELKYTKNHSEDLIADLQAKYISETGINTLKIKNNGILGWYIEIPATQKSKVPDNFIHRQTLVNNIRYITKELMALQARLSEAFDEWFLLEQQLYAKLIEDIMKYYDEINYAIKLISLIDIYTNFAILSIERGYIRPEITDEPILKIKNGKHPILAAHIEDFTKNDCELTEDSRVCLLTGPNMAGKSTYLRQNALLIVLAQIGCYVPATEARIGLIDRLFSRIGASDDIARGRSTFMVEMIETATILNQATEKSFVILDEVGRGTSTYDGLAIAWAVIENLYRVNKCRVLFATHYRELTVLQNVLKNIQCKTLKVQEWNNEVIFHHKIIDGIADKSYGIHVASLAGIPQSVVKRATELLKNFESKNSIEHLEAEEKTSNSVEDLISIPKPISDQMSFFYDLDNDELRKKLKAINLDLISPRNALDILYELKELA